MVTISQSDTNCRTVGIAQVRHHDLTTRDRTRIQCLVIKAIGTERRGQPHLAVFHQINGAHDVGPGADSGKRCTRNDLRCATKQGAQIGIRHPVDHAPGATQIPAWIGAAISAGDTVEIGPGLHLHRAQPQASGRGRLARGLGVPKAVADVACAYVGANQARHGIHLATGDATGAQALAHRAFIDATNQATNGTAVARRARARCTRAADRPEACAVADTTSIQPPHQTARVTPAIGVRDHPGI